VDGLNLTDRIALILSHTSPCKWIQRRECEGVVGSRLCCHPTWTPINANTVARLHPLRHCGCFNH